MAQWYDCKLLSSYICLYHELTVTSQLCSREPTTLTTGNTMIDVAMPAEFEQKYVLGIALHEGGWLWFWSDHGQIIAGNLTPNVSILHAYQEAVRWAAMSEDCPMELTAPVIQLRQ